MKNDYYAETQNEALKLENQLCFPLYAAARKVIGLYTPFLKPLGITYTQYIVFLVLWEEDGITVGELGKKLSLDNGTLTPLLKKMEQQGFIKRLRSTADERVVIISLTTAGLALREQARDIPSCISQQIGLPPEDAGVLYRLLYRLLDEL